MVTTDLGACEWFVWDLRRSNLVDRGQLDQLVGEFLEKNPRADPPVLAEFLIKENILTQFQAERLLQGKTQGFVLGPFTLMDVLGAGSMGTVYKAHSKNDQQWYAVKVLPRRSMWNVRIARRKVRLFEQCQHPAVVPFVDVGTSGGMHYLAWPLVEGETLDKLVSREGKLSAGSASFYTLQTIEGLEVCHQQGLFHGLLKPSNLMIAADHQVRILDFGIGALLAETEEESLVDTMSTASSLASGLDCASPESIMDPTKLTPLGDQYSLGCVLYYCLSGQYPFADGTAAEKMMAHQLKQPTPLRQLVPDLPEGLAAIVERLMQKSPEARYANSGEVAEALRPFVQAPPAGVRSAVLVEQPRNNPTEKSRPQAPSTAPVAPAATPADSQSLARVAPSNGAAAGCPPIETSNRVPRKKPAPLTHVAKASGQRIVTPAAAAAAEASPARPARPMPPRTAPETGPKASLEERLGPAGIVISAFVVSVLAWLVTWKLF